METNLERWETKITEIQTDELVTHGVRQTEIIRSFSYEEALFFVLMGRRPSYLEKELLRAVIVARISHGITGQSTLAVRMAADCRSHFLHAIIAGFSTGAGIFHQGGLEGAMRELQHLSLIPSDQLQDYLGTRLKRKERIIGFGHRFYKKKEPRATLLLEIADELGFQGRHIGVARQCADILMQLKQIPINYDAASGAILLDLGFDPAIAHLIVMVGRCPMFAAAYLERLSDGRAPFQKIHIYDEI